MTDSVDPPSERAAKRWRAAVSPRRFTGDATWPWAVHRPALLDTWNVRSVG
jgi:hypothetical protein